MKPEFTREFKAEYAKAGAPYCCRNGEEATVLKWDGRRPNEPIVGTIGEDDMPCSWTISGGYISGEQCELTHDLVMLPLGMIDGKPVWWGDTVVDKHGNSRGADTTMNFEHGYWCWPVPAKAYPETTLSGDELHTEYNGDSGGNFHSSLKRVGNAALRHAIDAGQVVTKEDHEAGLQRLGESLRDVAVARDAKRDMAIAEVVQMDTYNRIVASSKIPLLSDLKMSLELSIASAK